MLKLDPNREPVAPKDAATLLVLRQATGVDGGVEVFCVRRHASSAFMGGVVVFPGGKLDEADGDDAYRTVSNGLAARATELADDADHALALLVCACRESLEEAGIVPLVPAVSATAVARMRADLDAGTSLSALLSRQAASLATAELLPFARWITPAAEQRRYDARFYMTALPDGQSGQHDERETVSSVWATPERLLTAFQAGDLMLAPPTVRALELMRQADDVASTLALCAEQSLLPICPEFTIGEDQVPSLTLPGDPSHSVAQRRVAGPTRFVLQDGKFVSREP